METSKLISIASPFLNAEILQKYVWLGENKGL